MRKEGGGREGGREKRKSEEGRVGKGWRGRRERYGENSFYPVSC